MTIYFKKCFLIIGLITLCSSLCSCLSFPRIINSLFKGHGKSSSESAPGVPESNGELPKALPHEPCKIEVADIPDANKVRIKVQQERCVPGVLRDVLANHYKENELALEEAAFNRVIGWKEDLENIACRYPNVNWKILSAIVKAETQGRTGLQVSKAKAVGMPQIKYQGAWAFIYDALFKEKIRDGSRFIKDYHNANLRVRYKSQLGQIRRYLKEQGILVEPTDHAKPAYNRARFATWTNLKSRLRRHYKPGDYQVAVDIAAMYIDHLIITFRRVRQQISRIKGYVRDDAFDPFNEEQLPGAIGMRWNIIKSRLQFFEDTSDSRKRTLARLDQIAKRLEDPSIYSAAYIFGLSKCLEYVQSGMKFPKSILQYVKKIDEYYVIFNEIDTYGLGS